jgi:hypothetical protein
MVKNSLRWSRQKQFARESRHSAQDSLIRKITRAAGKPSIYLPPEIVKQTELRIGQEVAVYLADKNKIVIEAAD